MPATRVLILYNAPTLSADHRDADSEHEILYTVEKVAAVLRKAGYAVSELGVHVDPGELIDGLRRERPDVVFNLFEGLPQRGQTEAYAVGILDWFGVPYTGCTFQALSLARNKPLTKQLLRGAGLPTPRFELVERMPCPPCRIGWPVIVKPSNQDASVGLDQGSVVTDQLTLERRVEYILAEYGPPVLVEEFIPGREFAVGLIETPELRTLPVSEILFTDKSADFWPIQTYDAKWKPGTRDYEATPPEHPVLPPPLQRRLDRLSKAAFHLLGCRDYARVDFRVKPPHKAYILEVNPNPDFSPMAGLAYMFDHAGTSHAETTLQLVRNALARGANPLPKPVVTEVVPWS